MRLEREGKYKESLIALMKYRELMREKGEKKDTVTTADMYSEMGEAFVRQSEYPKAEMYYTKEKKSLGPHLGEGVGPGGAALPS